MLLAQTYVPFSITGRILPDHRLLIFPEIPEGALPQLIPILARQPKILSATKLVSVHCV